MDGEADLAGTVGQFWRPAGGIFPRMSREKVEFCTIITCDGVEQYLIILNFDFGSIPVLLWQQSWYSNATLPDFSNGVSPPPLLALDM